MSDFIKETTDTTDAVGTIDTIGILADTNDVFKTDLKSNKISETNVNVVIDELNKLDLNLDKLEQKSEPLEEIKTQPEPNYSKILYYSLVFNDNEYNKILLKVLELGGNQSNSIGLEGVWECVAVPNEPNKINQISKILEYESSESNESNKVNKLNNAKTPEQVYNDFLPIINKLSVGDKFIPRFYSNEINSNSKILYKLNDKFHTTLLYLGGKKDLRALEFNSCVGKDIVASIISVGISDKFIVCGIELEANTVPYYGNLIKHITIGLRKADIPKFKLFPKDSPTAFVEGYKINLDVPMKIMGKVVVEYSK